MSDSVYTSATFFTRSESWRQPDPGRDVCASLRWRPSIDELLKRCRGTDPDVASIKSDA